MRKIRRRGTLMRDSQIGLNVTALDPSTVASEVCCQVVGWPPLRAHRINSMVNQTKLPATEEFQSTVEKTKSKNGVVDMTNSGIHENKNNVKEKRQLKTALIVKVNMDGIPIGRKVYLNAHKHWRICSVDPPQLSV
ncbi:Auxin-responsive protein IAA11 [Camellia lanceoleosa]|uniref:Auxin-responsive protein IAA11 n=1 Tax=Camellia lanceoleosa TaxID=1840588 RepID=A0ACC0IDP9_9ERIC|nr:Auxin-responsive protein IAA11 [Camellia lanceoleosa]